MALNMVLPDMVSSFPRNRCLHRDGGIFDLVECVDDPPSVGCLVPAERRAGMRKQTLTDVAGLPATFGEGIDRFDLIAGKRPLPRHTVSARDDVGFVPNSTVG
ncbi:hypothetical protein PF003_g34382 [Phytophthora fragariae]|nr:hypothetical protein PF003_g34382 [Phytophthora fragariae]